MENKQIVVAANAALSQEKLLDFLSIAGVAQKLTDKEKMQFVSIAQAYGLNPFKREIYCNCYGEGQYRTTSIITGYEVYIKRAERTGKLNGWHVEIEGNIEDKNLKAIVTINRKDWDKPFTHEVYFEEVCQYKKDGKLNSIWAKMPRFMTKKVAIAQGFRMCFSDELGGMPYTADEISQAEQAPIQAQPAQVPQELPLEADMLNALEQCTSVEQLRETARKIVVNFGDIYRPAVNAYWNAHKNDFKVQEAQVVRE